MDGVDVSTAGVSRWFGRQELHQRHFFVSARSPANAGGTVPYAFIYRVSSIRRYFILRLRRVHQPLIKPSDDMLQPLDAMPWLTRARKLVTFVWKSHHHGRNFSILQRPEKLFTTRSGWCAVVSFAEDEHHRCFDLVHESYRRPASKPFRIFEG